MDEARVREIEKAAAHAVCIKAEDVFNSGRDMFCVRAKTVAFRIIEEEGCATIYEMSDRWKRDRTALIYSRKKMDKMQFRPDLRNAYNEAKRYLSGVPTPHAERLMRVRKNASKPNKGSYRYKDSFTGLIFNGMNEVTRFFDCNSTSIRQSPQLRGRMTTIGLVAESELKSRRVRHLPTGHIYEGVNSASESLGVKSETILSHIYRKGDIKIRQWSYA